MWLKLAVTVCNKFAFSPVGGSCNFVAKICQFFSICHFFRRGLSRTRSSDFVSASMTSSSSSLPMTSLVSVGTDRLAKGPPELWSEEQYCVISRKLHLWWQHSQTIPCDPKSMERRRRLRIAFSFPRSASALCLGRNGEFSSWRSASSSISFESASIWLLSWSRISLIITSEMKKYIFTLSCRI